MTSGPNFRIDNDSQISEFIYMNFIVRIGKAYIWMNLYGVFVQNSSLYTNLSTNSCALQFPKHSK